MNDDSKGFSLRTPMTFGLAALLILVVGFGTWAATTEISGAIIAGGQIQVDQNRQVVQHADGGIVEEILVEEGDTVEAGEVMIRLDPTLLRSELTIVEGQYFELLARRSRLEAERDGGEEIVFPEILLTHAETDDEVAELISGQRNLFFARRASMDREVEQLNKRSDQIGNQIEGVEAQVEALAAQLSFVDEELESQRSLLARGLAQASRVLSLQREAARLAGERGELVSTMAQAEGESFEVIAVGEMSWPSSPAPSSPNGRPSSHSMSSAGRL